MPSQSGAGVEMIAAERQRQVEGEGWTASHDDAHVDGELAKAAAAYAWPGDMDSRDGRRVHRSVLWPWEDGWSPGDRVRELAKAGALIAAEIDRLQRGESHVDVPTCGAFHDRSLAVCARPAGHEGDHATSQGHWKPRAGEHDAR